MQTVCCASRFLPPAVGRPSGFLPSQRPGARSVKARAEPRGEFDPESQDTLGVGTLLDRDLAKLKVQVNAEELMAVFADDAAPSSSGNGSGESSGGKQGEAAAEEAAPRQAQRGPAAKRADKLREEAGVPKRAREAIDRGLQEYAAGRHQAALDLFQLSLELPGAGVMRLAGSPKEYSCASEGEENAALYNMACCWAALGQKQSALTVLEALLDNSFSDYAAIRSDPDLAPLRGPELDKLLAKHDGLVAKLFGKKKEAAYGDKPWLQW